MQASLGRRLLLGVILVNLLYWAAITGLTLRDTADEVYELFDAHLSQTALALLRVTDPDDSDPSAISIDIRDRHSLAEAVRDLLHLDKHIARLQAAGKNVPQGAAASSHDLDLEGLYSLYEKNFRYQIWSGEGRLLLKSANAPDAPMSAADGFSETTDADGRQWRFFGIWDQHRTFRILVAEPHDLRHRLIMNVARNLAVPLFWGLPLLFILLALAIRQAMKPLGGLAAELAARAPQSLEILDAAQAPREVRPLVESLNALLARMGRTLENERRFTANAAHELRTPLAAIQAHLHAVRHAANAAETEHALNQLQRGVERSIRLVGQLLTLARLDPQQALPVVETVNVCEIAENVCAELAPLALRREQSIHLETAPGTPGIEGSSDLIATLLTNLIDNAIRYTQAGGAITVRAAPCQRGIQLLIEDNGPGIPPANRERVFERFYRLARHDQPGEQPGTGLGLAICRRIAELHQASIQLKDGPGGHGLTACVFLCQGCRTSGIREQESGIRNPDCAWRGG